MLAYSSIAHAGYISVGLAAGSQSGVQAVLFYLLVYAFMNVGAFAVIIAVGKAERLEAGGETLDDFAGLAGRKPGLAFAMAIFMLSLAGVPPLSGFLAKLYLFGAAVQADLVWLAIIGVLNSVLSAYYYLRVIVAMYLGKGPEGEPAAVQVCPAVGIGVGLASVAVVVLGFWPGLVSDLANLAATALFGG